MNDGWRDGFCLKCKGRTKKQTKAWSALRPVPQWKSVSREYRRAHSQNCGRHKKKKVVRRCLGGLTFRGNTGSRSWGRLKVWTQPLRTANSRLPAVILSRAEESRKYPVENTRRGLPAALHGRVQRWTNSSRLRAGTFTVTSQTWPLWREVNGIGWWGSVARARNVIHHN